MKSIRKRNQGLTVKGTGYISPDGPNGYPRTMMTLRRSNIIPVTNICSRPRVTNSHCACTQETSLSLDKCAIQSQYFRTLEQQVKLLEIENKFLKQATERTVPSSQQTHGQIVARGNEVSLNGRDWCQLPPFHPNIGKMLSSLPTQTASGGSMTRQTGDIQKNQYLDIGSGSSICETRQQSSTSERLSRRQQNVGVDLAADKKEPRNTVTSDADLLQSLEEKNQEVVSLQLQLREKNRTAKKQEERIRTMNKRLKDAESDISSRSESDARDKRALMEEILELQRRLDDLTPTLAEKEARIARVENERDTVVSKLRVSNSTISELQLKLNERIRKEELRIENEKSAQSEIERLKDKMFTMKENEERCQKREEELLDEISAVKKELREAQLKYNNDKTIMNQISSENSKLISENSSLATDIARLEYNIERQRLESSRSIVRMYTEEEMVELRLMIKAHKTQISTLEDKLKAAQERSERLEKEMDERDNGEETTRNERLRIQKELDALQALSRSLSTENKMLREEKMSLNEKIVSLKSKILSRDNTIKNMEDELLEKDKKHEEALCRAEEESRIQNKRTLELEELSRRVKELSESLPTTKPSVRIVTSGDNSRSASCQQSFSEMVECSVDNHYAEKPSFSSELSKMPIMEEPTCSRAIHEAVDLKKSVAVPRS